MGPSRYCGLVNCNVQSPSDPGIQRGVVYADFRSGPFGDFHTAFIYPASRFRTLTKMKGAAEGHGLGLSPSVAISGIHAPDAQIL